MELLLRSDLLHAVSQPAVDEPKLERLLQKLHDRHIHVDDVKEKDGSSLLQCAILANPVSSSVIPRLIQHGANPQLSNKEGRTALHMAAIANNVDLLAMWVKSQTYLHQQDNDGNTLLHLAVLSGCVEAVEWLTFLGADPDIPNKDNKTARNCATSMKSFALRVILRDSKAGKPFPKMLTPMDVAYEPVQLSGFILDVVKDRELSTSSEHVTSMFRHCDHARLRKHMRAKDAERFWGQGLEFMTNSTLTLDVTFTLHDKPDRYHELVMRIKEEREDAVDFMVEEIIADDTEDGDAVATFQVRIHKSGHMGVLYRPITDTVTLGKAGGEVTSSVDERVRVQTHVTEGASVCNNLELHLQVQRPSTARTDIHTDTGQRPERAKVQISIHAMTDFVSLTTGPSAVDKETLQRIISTAVLPLTEFFNPSRPAVVLSRSESVSSTSTRSQSTCTSEDEMGDDDDDDDDETEIRRETRKWTRQPDVIELKKQTPNVAVKTSFNTTTTVVQMEKNVPDESVRRAVAEQYLLTAKRVLVRFHVFAQKNAGTIDDCRYIGVVFKVKQDDDRYQDSWWEGYDNVKVTDSVTIYSRSRLKLTAKDTSGRQVDAELGFEQGMNRSKRSYPATFLGDPTKPVLVRCCIEKQKMGDDEDSNDRGEHREWKHLINFDFEIQPENAKNKNKDRDKKRTVKFSKGKESKDSKSKKEKEVKGKSKAVSAAGASKDDSGAVEDVSGAAGPLDYTDFGMAHTTPTTSTSTNPFNDQFLMKLSEVIPAEDMYRLGIELLTTSNKVDNILRANPMQGPIVQIFKLLVTAKNERPNPQAFHQHLTNALKNLTLNSVLEWLKANLTDWHR